MQFIDRLAEGVSKKQSPLMVGLDPRANQLPAEVVEASNSTADAYFAFCQGVIEACHEFVAVVKPQLAFFECLGPDGLIALYKVIQMAREHDLLVVLDGKRNDIGSTATAYAEAYLGTDSPWKGDALTVSPYLGDDSLTPFVDRCRTSDSGIFVLVKTSNPGGGRWQDRTCDGQTIFESVGAYVEELAATTKGSSGFGDVGAVVGATYPEQLASLRKAMPHTWFLVPGFGAQGGTAKDVAPAFDSDGLGAIINSSRGIIFAYNKAEYRELDWKTAVQQATKDTVGILREAQ